MHRAETRILNVPVVVGALGYFVDIYDLLLFGIVRNASLLDLGVAKEDLLKVGGRLLDYQMWGLLVGGIIWGILGDKRGRLSVLFGSIFLYSVANIANAYVQTIDQYAWLRFIAGVGLAGELGAAITLVSEVMPKETRGYGTAIVAGVGICGAVVANLVGGFTDWRTAYIIGGVLGLLLLGARISMYESGMYSKVLTDAKVRRGEFFMLFTPWARLKRYIACILVGVPIWYVIGILIIFSPEMSKAIGVQGEIAGGDSIMYAYMGLALGDLASGVLCQWFKNRLKVMTALLLATLGLVLFYLHSQSITGGLTTSGFYLLCVGLGFTTGYWAIFVTNASEQFGTNLRATAATTVPNFVRGSVVLTSGTFRALVPSMGLVASAQIVGIVCIAIALIAVKLLEEPFGKELEYLEH